MNTENKYTKIVATLGPASSNQAVLEEMFKAGVTVVRMNFSHGTHTEHQSRLNLVRSVAKKLGIRIAILQDLAGPKIRIGDFKEGKVVLKKGQAFALTTESILGDTSIVHINYPKLPYEIIPGASIMIFDGKISLLVKKIVGNTIHCVVVAGGEISNKKGVNIPGAHLSIKSLTEKDKKDLQFGIKNKVDFVAFSFVRTASDVLELRALLNKSKSKAMIVSKIETTEAIENFEEILEVTDAVMIARGDLAVEVGTEHVPVYQKQIISLCNEKGKPVITATQMLDSMEHTPVPTRAEVSDIANAIFDGTDAVMLSGETAAGMYPVESVQVMNRIALVSEKSLPPRKFIDLGEKGNMVNAVTLSVVRVAEDVGAKAIIALTESGLTARMINRFRTPFPVYAVSPHESVLNQMMLSFGVIPVHLTCSNKVDTFTKEITQFVLKNKIAKKGEKVVLSAGMKFGKIGSTNSLFVVEI
jgi:pyruvate kinase